ncbi:MAG: hypothetical protein IPL65_01330 [Lewinellaceae bacterium]|nr:hypothetical protein [Lewinellaceae bacterium]
MPSGSEDFVVLPDGSFMAGQGSKLFYFSTVYNGWKELADLRMYGVKNISRMAVSADGKLVVVD